MLLRLLLALVPGTRVARLQVEDQLARIELAASAAAADRAAHLVPAGRP